MERLPNRQELDRPGVRLTEVKRLLDKDPKIFSPVIALAIYDLASTKDGVVTADTRTVAVVRDPRANLVHPNVISAPTQRIPPELLAGLMEDYKLSDTRDDNKSGLVINAWTRESKKKDGDYNGSEIDNNDSGYFITCNLLSQKLGVADSLAKGSFRIKRISVVSNVYGLVYGGNRLNPDEYEPTNMVGLGVFINKDDNTDFPDATTSYSKIKWVEVGKFSRLAEKDPLAIEAIGDPFDLCVNGLCVTAADETSKYLINQGTCGDGNR